MKIYVHLWQYLAEFFLECGIFQTKFEGKIRTHILWTPTFGSEFILMSLPCTYSNNCTIIRYINILICGNPATCFGQFQGGIQQKYTMASFIVGVPLALKDIDVFVVMELSWKCSRWFPLHSCPTTKYFVMLFTKKNCLMQIACVTCHNVTCGLSVCAIFFHIMS